jgi:hypothetical protein
MEALREWIHQLPPWINLKLCLGIIFLGGGLWFLFRVMGEIVKVLIALAIVGAGIFLLAKAMHWM